MLEVGKGFSAVVEGMTCNLKLKQKFRTPVVFGLRTSKFALKAVSCAVEKATRAKRRMQTNEALDIFNSKSLFVFVIIKELIRKSNRLRTRSLGFKRRSNLERTFSWAKRSGYRWLNMIYDRKFYFLHDRGRRGLFRG